MSCAASVLDACHGCPRTSVPVPAAPNKRDELREDALDAALTLLDDSIGTFVKGLSPHMPQAAAPSPDLFPARGKRRTLFCTTSSPTDASRRWPRAGH